MDLKKLSRGELIAIIGAILLAVSVFLPWYHAGTKFVVLAGKTGVGTYTGWEAHNILRFLFLAAALAPLILAWIVIRDHALSWPRGELTAVIAIAAFGLILYIGVVAKPGEPSSGVSLKIGWFLALIGILLMLVGSVSRANQTPGRRKPPGTF